jgi:hypothetical protein
MSDRTTFRPIQVGLPPAPKPSSFPVPGQFVRPPAPR